MTNPRISVVIAAYNAEKYIKICLESVLAQTFEDFEVIVVNDGSKDNTQTIVQEFVDKDERVILINQENKNVGGARNTALKIVRGEYITYLDADDTFDPNFLEVLYGEITKYNADIASACFKIVPSLRKWPHIEHKKTELITGTKNIFKKLLIPPYWHCLAKLYRKSTFEDINFEENTFFEDIQYTSTVLSKNISVVVCSDTNYNHLINDYSVTAANTASPAKSLQRLKQTLKGVRIIQKNNIPIKNFYIVKEKKSIFRIRHYNDRYKWYLLGIPLLTRYKTFDVEGYIKANNIKMD